MTAKIKFRVLVVDDNEDAADGLVAAIKCMGYDAQCAYDPITALGLAEKYQPQALLLDIMMPGMDGYELASKLRQVVDFSEATLIAITALGKDEDRHKGWDAGFHYFLVKPVNHEELERLLGDLAGNLHYPIQQKCPDIEEMKKSRLA